MKRKKLRLHRETLRSLNEAHLAQAAGGGETYELLTGCACTDGCSQRTCGSGSGGTGGTGGGTIGCPSGTCFDPPSYCYCG
jgi:hypothetical protein